MRPIRNVVYALAMVSLAAPVVRADLMYKFSGTTSFMHDWADIPAGTPFSGTFSYDPNAPATLLPDIANYATGLIAVSFPGVELEPIPGGFAQVGTDQNAGPFSAIDYFEIDSNFIINGDPSLTPLDVQIVIYFPVGMLSSLQLPAPLPLADSVEADLTATALDSQAICCGGDASVVAGPFGNIQAIPEPGTPILLVTAIAVAAVFRRNALIGSLRRSWGNGVTTGAHR